MMKKFPAGRRPFRMLAQASLALGTLWACDINSALDVTDPDVLNVDDFASAVGANPLRFGVIQDFTVAVSGTQDGAVVHSGNLADEIYSTDTFDDRLFPNQRTTTEDLGALVGFYRNLHRARSGASRTIPILQEFAPTPAANIGEMYAIRGYSEMFFAEIFCSGVPFSDENEEGEPLTTTEMLTRAVASFDSALTLAGTDAKVRPFAQIGRARALLNLDRPADAAAAVQGVATTYKYELFHSQASGRQENGIWNALSVSAPRYAMYIPAEASVQYLRTPADPRVPWVATTRAGFNTAHRNLPDQLKYTRAGTFTLADGIEARLIELEATLRGGSAADRLAVFNGLNDLRANAGVAGIPPIASAPATQDAAVDMLFEERALWMWLTGHRLGDLRRLIRQYGRGAETVFPTGPLRAPLAGNYGTDVNLIIPAAERNNSKFSGCIDRGA
jgi:starch-binding outer membrane protein, SusD/RagB family